MDQDDDALLSAQDLSVHFGGVAAVEGLDFSVPSGSIVSLIGPNGAGKTTVLNSISGFVRARGKVVYRGIDLLSGPSYRRAELGIGRTFQNLQLFGGMTLLDNVVTGQHARLGGNVLLDMLYFPVRRREVLARERAMEILKIMELQQYAHRRATDLPFGVQKLAGVARALAVQPSLLLMDEPAAGLNAQEVQTLGELVRGLRRDLGLTILLVEHNMRLVMGISDWIVVLDEGRKLTEGPPAAVSADPAVIEAYLGEEPAEEVVEGVREELAHGS